MNYLVTGGCGFIGSHVAEALVREGQAVRILDNLSSGRESNLVPFGDRVELIVGDIRDRGAVDTAMRGIDGVFHEAALVSVVESLRNPAECYDINVTGTLNVLTSARDAEVKRVVLASSAAVYGNDPALPKAEDMRPQPASPYAVSKVTDEQYLSVLAGEYGLTGVSLRYFNVYGPRQDPGSPYSGVVSRFLDALAAGQRPVVYGDGRQTRDFIFVEDVARANLLAMRTATLGQVGVLNVGTGQQTSLLDLLDALSEVTGRAFEIAFQDARAGDVRHSVADVSRARRDLGFESRYGLREGLRKLHASPAAR